MKSQIISILCCFLSIYGYAHETKISISENKSIENETRAAPEQKDIISGTVTDQTGFPATGATVSIKGTTKATMTDIDGKFEIDAKAGDVLIFTYVGFLTQEITVGSQKMINVTLIENSLSLEEVVVMGYGVQKKKLITGATVQVTGQDIEKLNFTDVLGALQSQSPGVNITSNSGLPGEGYKINIRGLGTIKDATPLYVIDGVAGGDINNLNQSDIEAVDILKDAASAAIYGARAANGVVLITTKKGKRGKPTISYDTYYGFQNVYKMLKPLDAKQYMAIQNEVNFNEGTPAFDYAERLPVIYKQIMDGTFNGTDWMDETRNKNALTYSHAINMTGGTDMSTYSLGFSYTSQDGILGKQADPGYERYTARINSDYVLLKVKDFDAIKIGENVTFTQRIKNGRIGIDDMYWNDIRNMLTNSPLIPVYNKDGGFYDQTNKLEDEWNIEGTTYNPIAAMVYQRSMNKEKSNSLLANVYIEIQPIKNLKFKSSYGYKKEDGTYRQYVPAFQLSSTTGQAVDQISQSAWNGFNWTLDNTLSYIFKVKDVHNFDVMVGQSVEKSGNGESVGASNTSSQFPGSFDYAWVSNGSGDANMRSSSGSKWGDSALASFFGRVNYNLKETYLFSFIFRADGSSNFAKGNQWRQYPSASAGWVMTNEKFMEPVAGIVDFFKLRASWGQNGNCNIGSWLYSAQMALYAPYGFGTDKDRNYIGAYLRQIPNPEIKWETSDQTDIGFDSRFFNSRLGISFDWYRKKTIDWLVEAPGLDIWGADPPTINGGSVRNQGIEVALNWNDRIQDFNYGVKLNLASNRNKILSIDNDEGIIRGPSGVLIDGTPEIFRAQVGYPIGAFWGYKTAGVFQNAEQLASTPVKLNNAKIGDVIFVDHDGNGVIDDNDRTMIGNPHPKLTLGFSLNLGWKGADLSVTTYGAFGHQIARSIRAFNTQQIFERWHGEGTSNYLPRLTNMSHPNWNYFSETHIEDADYLKIQNVTLGYDFKNILPKLPLGQARLYIAAQNLFTFTKYSGMDPDIGYSAGVPWSKGVDLGYYPTARTIMFGANLKF
ncbi:SusC/RagA family TonB-linked outer membrane protein [Dysgonomonas termitidis]|uniref:SusC/RagA family TonB-linked outer membrane protein n=1 Tax=Dysgonomonas termitidis TaxID=1516126 RepID=A0ABV9L2G5_9BACT